MQFLDTANAMMTSTMTHKSFDYADLYRRELELGKKAIAVANSVQTAEQSVVAIRYLERVILHAKISVTVELCLRKMASLRLKFYQPQGNAPHENAFQIIQSNL